MYTFIVGLVYILTCHFKNNSYHNSFFFFFQIVDEENFEGHVKANFEENNDHVEENVGEHDEENYHPTLFWIMDILDYL